MQNYQLNVPILFLVFNRPDLTRHVLERIREVQPKELFIAADGPREGNVQEKEQCNKVRDLFRQIDWECKVHTLFRDKNLGCKHAVSSAINWFFEHINKGIILEDDCLPEIIFFKFCDELLEKYNDVDQVMHISGTNLNWKNYKENNSYYFSYHSPAWGWATWKRAWEKYDIEMSTYMNEGSTLIKKRFLNVNERLYLKALFRLCYKNQIDTWDYQWLYSIAINNGLAIIPGVNMVSNIGFGSDATHTTGVSNSLDVSAGGKLNLPLRHPDAIKHNINVDKSYFYHVIQRNTSLMPLILRNLIPLNNQTIKNIVRKLRISL